MRPWSLRMPPFLLLALALWSTFSVPSGVAVAAASTHRRHGKKNAAAAVAVEGTVLCDTCFPTAVGTGKAYLAGASVEMECRGAATTRVRRVAKTDPRGVFGVRLDASVDVRSCSVKPLRGSSGSHVCAVPASNATTSGVGRLRWKGKHGARVYNAGFFKFRPVRQPELCVQKLAPHSRLTDDEKFPVATPRPRATSQPQQLPLGRGPFRRPRRIPRNSIRRPSVLPPNPLQPPLLPPNPITPPPSLLPPITPPPSLLPPITPPPSLLAPNPLTPPPSLLPPNPFQRPPPSIIPRNPFQPPSPPSLLPPNPFRPPSPPSLLPPNPFQQPTPPPSLLPPNPFQRPPSPPSLFPSNPFQQPSPPPPFLNIPPIPGLSQPSPPPPSFRFPPNPFLPNNPFFPGFPPATPSPP